MVENKAKGLCLTGESSWVVYVGKWDPNFGCRDLKLKFGAMLYMRL